MMITRTGSVPGMLHSVVEHGGILFVAGITGKGEGRASGGTVMH